MLYIFKLIQCSTSVHLNETGKNSYLFVSIKLEDNKNSNKIRLVVFVSWVSVSFYESGSFSQKS